MNKPRFKKLSLRRGWLGIRALQDSQRRFIYQELSQAREVLPLLKKHRNGGKWSLEERTILLRSVTRLSPYLVPLVLPGGFLILPLLAWWLNRKRNKRIDDQK